MLSMIQSCTLMGMDVAEINVEIDLSNGLPMMNLVGLPDQEIKESKERVRSAMNNSGFEFPLAHHSKLSARRHKKDRESF